MKELLLETARETGLADEQELAKFFEEVNGDERIDDAMLRCPFFTEDVVLRLFASGLESTTVSSLSSASDPLSSECPSRSASVLTPIR